MADSKIITNPNQKETEQTVSKKKWVFGGTADVFKDWEFLWSDSSKNTDIDKTQDFFDPLEELIPVDWEEKIKEDSIDKNSSEEPKIQENKENSDFDLSWEFEPIVQTEKQNTINNASNLTKNEEKDKEEKSEDIISDNKKPTISSPQSAQTNDKNKDKVSVDSVDSTTSKEIEKESIPSNSSKENNDKETKQIKKEVFTSDEKKPEQRQEQWNQDKIEVNKGSWEISPTKKTIEKKEEEKKEEENKNIDDTVVEESKEKEPEKSDLKSKFYDLLSLAKKVYEMKELKKEGSFDVVGMKTENQEINYSIYLWYNLISFDKKEKKWDKIDSHNLSFVIKDEKIGLEVLIDKEVLFSEQKDLIVDESKKAQVIEKMSKFSFLIEQEIKIIEKNKKEQEEKEKRRWLKGIFRNF